ncbi:hypothetical protein WJ542_19160 [Paraburkholderia sp. B3]|uniref:hypothetical protein n=1 Tax=Paraburkholderia sp. B3 TaxID=3134791 RepID=UPI00398202DD
MAAIRPGGSNGAIRQISVTRIGNGKTAIYETDRFALWITDFELALQVGEFDD